MRNGSYIRALGRQSFEPSQGPSVPDIESPDHGSSTSEQSQEMQRRLIKAQNDVLATVGVCLRDTKGQETSEAIMQENEVGLLVGAVDLTITYLASWPLVGIRNRLQTYRTYEGWRYKDVLIMSWRSNNIFQMLSGMPAHLCYQLVNVGRDYLQARFLRWLSRKPLFINKKTGKPRRFVLNSLDKIFSTCSWFLVYPLYQHSILQSLHLIPPTPLLPPVTSFVPFSALSPLSLPELTTPSFSLVTVSALATQALGSYFLFSFLQQSVCAMLQYNLFHRLRRVLPRPDNPDGASISGALDDDDIDSYGRWDSGRQPHTHPRRTVMDEPSIAAIMIEETRTFAEFGDRERSFSATVQIEHQQRSGSPPVDATQLEEDLNDFEARALEAAIQTNGGPLPHPHHHTPADPAAVTARMRSARQQHRVTRLSQHPADVVASHASDGIATALSSGFESAVMRTVARSFMIRQMGVDPSPIYKPSDVFANWKLVTKALAGEWALMFMLFEGSYYATTFIGIRWFGYPRSL
ncbi:uncharacterized protein LAJ45_06276 [Morchella importuna]|uniref:Uncharacterized protein n=1 Tax=Morchella conica CCBAS932 TaxID=1392247 RepID=A0A3N4L7W5_9PEZI|nr:uncharacterized protein LAJ45_06276 [Morchella importuna]KAH8149645.1 hypothetical protein LAJ45_06276 [Morchella importuna]RPB17582.1 hypothetical protein P167DRAFT_531143 [Morchella conica CCBAS932]